VTLRRGQKPRLFFPRSYFPVVVISRGGKFPCSHIHFEAWLFERPSECGDGRTGLRGVRGEHGGRTAVPLLLWARLKDLDNGCPREPVATIAD
jgi:hypothetical protein